MTARREPNERVIPELDQEDWDIVLQWRPLIYQTIRSFVSKAISRPVHYRGRFGEPSFEWLVGGGVAYGVDPVSLCQDLEYRALEAAAVAVHEFDPEKGHGEHISGKYLTKAIGRELQHEFDRWLLSSASPNTMSYGSSVVPILPDDAEEPSYLDPHDQETGDGLTDSDREKLQTALGALSSREAWALRMIADKVPTDVIAERLGFKSTQAANRFIQQARETGRKAFEAQS